MTMSELTQQEIADGFSPIPENGSPMTKESFRDAVRAGAITEGSGIGYYATATAMTKLQALLGNFAEAKGEDPDIFFKAIPEPFTHVVWFDNGQISQAQN
jgi:hypothetical protein